MSDEQILPDATDERNARCIPVAKQILPIIARAEVGDLNTDELKKANADLAREMLTIYLENDIRLSDVGYIHRLALQAFDVLTETIRTTLDDHSGKVWDEYWGKEAAEVTVSDLDLKVKKIESK